MDDVSIELMRLGSLGYCCSQIMVKLFLDYQGKDNPDLVRAMSGLCKGMGDCSGPCGVLTGAMCVIGLYAGKGDDHESSLEGYSEMKTMFREWFSDQVGGKHGGIMCADILGPGCPSPDTEVCGGILSASVAKVVGILAEYGIDPEEPR